MEHSKSRKLKLNASSGECSGTKLELVPRSLPIESDSSRIDDNVDDSNNKHVNQQQRRPWPALEVFEFHGRHRELWSLLGDIFGEQSVGMLMKSLMDALKEGSSVSRRKARGPGFCSRIIDLLKHYYENGSSSPDEYERTLREGIRRGRLLDDATSAKLLSAEASVRKPNQSQKIAATGAADASTFIFHRPYNASQS